MGRLIPLRTTLYPRQGVLNFYKRRNWSEHKQACEDELFFLLFIIDVIWVAEWSSCLDFSTMTTWRWNYELKQLAFSSKLLFCRWILSAINLFLILYFINFRYLPTCICASCSFLVSTEDRRCQRSYKWQWPAMWILRIDTSSPRRTESKYT